MWSKERVSRLVPVIAVLLLCCVEAVAPMQPPALRLMPAVGNWVGHVEGGSRGASIELFHVSMTGDPTSPLQLVSLPTRTWRGETAPVLVAIPTNGGPTSSGAFVWEVPEPAAHGGSIDVRVQGDTMRGTLTTDSAGVRRQYTLVALRVSANVMPVLHSSSKSPAADSTPLVLLRLDDDPPSDTIVIPRLLARHLFGEVAVPTALVGLQGRPAWGWLDTLTEVGFTLAAHSRFHTATTGSSLELITEVLGSLGDLAAHGHSTTVFVQPGTWEDSIDFSSPELLQNWRGALFQTFTSVFEAYAWPPSQPLPLVDSLAMGIGHVTVTDGATHDEILHDWDMALDRGRFITILIHSANVVPVNSLDWFLDSLANAVRGGRIRLAHSSADALP